MFGWFGKDDEVKSKVDDDDDDDDAGEDGSDEL